MPSFIKSDRYCPTLRSDRSPSYPLLRLKSVLKQPNPPRLH
ncbi:MAG TPA: hypothetical protein V6C91_13810 [Coleofasciculaceae cyanobacterium]